MACKARDASKACAVLVLLCLLHVVAAECVLYVFGLGAAGRLRAAAAAG